MIVGLIQDRGTWDALIEWAIQQDFPNYATKPQSVVYRVKNVLEGASARGEFSVLTDDTLEQAKAILTAHYAEKEIA